MHNHARLPVPGESAPQVVQPRFTGSVLMAKLLTISQLAGHCGVTVRAVRHYHRVGLLPEPARDDSGYRRYGAQAVVDLVRIKVLADAGVPLAQVSRLLNADPDEFGAAVAGIDEALQQQIGQLEHRRQQLVGLLAGDQLVLPSEIAEMLSDLREMGVSAQGVQIERDGWILLAALSPEVVPEWTRHKRAALADPEFRRIYLAYDEARDWDPADPRLKPLADRTVEWTATRHDAVVGARSGTLPSEPNVVLVAQLINAESAYTSPALNRLAELCRPQLNP
jgi:DNA-binding transcriptional MerR regulator